MTTAEIPSPLNTFQGWLALGRSVRKGETADYYLLSPDESTSIALFREDQTDFSLVEDLTGWTKIIPATDRPQLKRRVAKELKDGRQVVKVEYHPESKVCEVWCGPNKDAIDQLKKSNFRYVMAQHRWVAIRDDINAVVKGLEANKANFRVELSVT